MRKPWGFGGKATISIRMESWAAFQPSSFSVFKDQKMLHGHFRLADCGEFSDQLVVNSGEQLHYTLVCNIFIA